MKWAVNGIAALVTCLSIAYACDVRVKHAQKEYYISGCFDTMLDMYSKLGLKEVDSKSLNDFCEQKRQLHHSNDKI